MDAANTGRGLGRVAAWRSALRGLAVAGGSVLAAAASLSAHAAATFAVPPMPPGPYAVACSNVAQDFSRVGPGEDVQAYWEGLARPDGTKRYATQLLAEPANTLAVSFIAPAEESLYGSFAGRAVSFVVIVCHPTAAGDPRADYLLPTGRHVPHMQRGADAPLWPEGSARFPLLLFSHGYGGSPISNDYVAAVATLASYGYVVAAPFHGDFRFTKLQVDDFTDFFQLVLNLQDFLAMQALRPLSLSATIDLMLAHPHWQERIDATQIGGFGASQGGQSLLLMAGAGMTKSFGLSWSQVTHDPRLKAAVGYVPYFGQVILPSFGRDQRGLDGITLPYLAISGTADTTAPIVETIIGVERLAGPRELVALEGVEHGFDVASTDDIFTWAVTFLDAEVRGDPLARARLTRMARVAGGGDDWVVIPYNGVAPANFSGLWWNAPAGSEAGWGINFAHQGDVIFATWFTYDVDGTPLWFAVTASRTAAGAYAGPVYRVTGPPFGAVPFDPAVVAETAVGSATFTFADNNNGTFAYNVGAVAQSKPITRQVFSAPVPTCTWGAQPDLALATNYQDLWWKSPASSESGWGINFIHQGNTIFATWFTYGQDGKPRWFALVAPLVAPKTYAGNVIAATGPAYNASPFDPATVIESTVGTATLAFADGNHATFTSTVHGITQTKAITRQVFAAPGTICQ